MNTIAISGQEPFSWFSPLQVHWTSCLTRPALSLKRMKSIILYVKNKILYVILTSSMFYVTNSFLTKVLLFSMSVFLWMAKYFANSLNACIVLWQLLPLWVVPEYFPRNLSSIKSVLWWSCHQILSTWFSLPPCAFWIFPRITRHAYLR